MGWPVINCPQCGAVTAEPRRVSFHREPRAGRLVHVATSYCFTCRECGAEYALEIPKRLRGESARCEPSPALQTPWLGSDEQSSLERLSPECLSPERPSPERLSPERAAPELPPLESDENHSQGNVGDGSGAVERAGGSLSIGGERKSRS